MHEKRISPLRYPGGKGVLGKFLSDIMIENKLTGGTYYEPYAGGAGAALYLLFSGVAGKIIINDADYRIYAIWESIKNHTDEFLKRLNDCAISIESWYEHRNVYNNPTEFDLIDVGFSTFFLNRANRSGILANTGPIGGLEQKGKYKIDARFNKKNLIERILKIVNISNKILIKNEDAVDFLSTSLPRSRGREKVFVYLDPPYFKRGRELYISYHNDSDHKRLSDYLKRQRRLHWLVSYDNEDFIRNLYCDYRKSVFSLSYTLQEKRVAKELLLFSPQLSLPESMRIGKKISELSLEANP